MPLVLLALQTASCILTNVYGLTVPRFSNAVSVMFLLYIGQQLKGRLRVQFDNPFLFAAALLIVYESSLLTGPVALNHNAYKDVLHLSAGATSALYAVCFLSRKIEKCRIGKWIELCGRESFHIMALHIVGFKLFTMLLMAFGVMDGGLECTMTPRLGNNVLWLACYTVCGMAFPVIFVHAFRKLKSSLGNVLRRGRP